jgi:basic membrane lipoprotein Med (substrate-binding protein (PBP1-ABC) superfamily)
MIPKKINGYIYSQYKNGIKKIVVGVGDYKNDENIPKPIEKEIKENRMKIIN